MGHFLFQVPIQLEPLHKQNYNYFKPILTHLLLNFNLIKKRSIDIIIQMQLNNLILVPISNDDMTIFKPSSQIMESPSRGLPKNCTIPDEICWKKSLSAFKKFKGKKDKQSKSIKSSQNNISLIQQNQQEDLKKKNFQLVDRDIKYSQLNAQVEKNIRQQQQTEYFDPNQAPFFQEGVQYFYAPSENQEQNEQENHDFYKKLQKTTKNKQQSGLKQKKSQNESKKKQEVVKYNQKQVYLNDPFIIIKSQRKNEILESIVKNEQLKREELKKTKPIKKEKKFIRSISMIGRQISGYSNQNSQSYLKQKSLDEMDIQYSNQDYGGQLPMIEFQLCNQFKHRQDYHGDDLASCPTRDNNSKQRQYAQKMENQIKLQQLNGNDPKENSASSNNNLIMEFPFANQLQQQYEEGQVRLQQVNDRRNAKSETKIRKNKDSAMKTKPIYNKKKQTNKTNGSYNNEAENEQIIKMLSITGVEGQK